eukprot:g15379.t1
MEGSSEGYPDTDEEAYFPETAYHLPPWPCDNTELLRAYLLSSYGVPHVPGGTVELASTPSNTELAAGPREQGMEEEVGKAKSGGSTPSTPSTVGARGRPPRARKARPVAATKDSMDQLHARAFAIGALALERARAMVKPAQSSSATLLSTYFSKKLQIELQGGASPCTAVRFRITRLATAKFAPPTLPPEQREWRGLRPPELARGAVGSAARSAPVQEAEVLQLAELGFPLAACRLALQESGGSSARAAEWLFDEGNTSAIFAAVEAEDAAMAVDEDAQLQEALLQSEAMECDEAPRVAAGEPPRDEAATAGGDLARWKKGEARGLTFRRPSHTRRSHRTPVPRRGPFGSVVANGWGGPSHGERPSPGVLPSSLRAGLRSSVRAGAGAELEHEARGAMLHGWLGLRVYQADALLRSLDPHRRFTGVEMLLGSLGVSPDSLPRPDLVRLFRRGISVFLPDARKQKELLRTWNQRESFALLGTGSYLIRQPDLLLWWDLPEEMVGLLSEDQSVVYAALGPEKQYFLRFVNGDTCWSLWSELSQQIKEQEQREHRVSYVCIAPDRGYFVLFESGGWAHNRLPESLRCFLTQNRERLSQEPAGHAGHDAE